MVKVRCEVSGYNSDFDKVINTVYISNVEGKNDVDVSESIKIENNKTIIYIKRENLERALELLLQDDVEEI